MPAARRTQSDPMLYALITFVGISIIAAVLAVVYYIKFEDARAEVQRTQNQLSEMLTPAEQQKLSQIVGPRKPRKTYLGTMDLYLDEMVTLIVGGPLEDTSAEQNVITAKRKVKETLAGFGIEDFDPNTTGLLRTIEQLKTNLDSTAKKANDINQNLEQLRREFAKVKTVSFETEQQLIAEKEQYEQWIQDIENKYNELKALLKKTTNERVQTLMEQRDKAEAQRKQRHEELLKTNAQLQITQNRLKLTQKELWKVNPPPDKEMAAFKPDGKIMLVDNHIVHINLGTADHIYRGLTFSVYDRTLPVSQNGKGKAEIEVYDVKKNVSAARVIHSEPRKPIIEGDLVANLVWDSNQSNIFVVAGLFDLDGDGKIEYDGAEKIKELIEKWGGKTTDTVSVGTDFLVLGRPPLKPMEPTPEQIELNPLAMDKFKSDSAQYSHYIELTDMAGKLWVPVLNTERFLYFIGYKSLATRADAF